MKISSLTHSHNSPSDSHWSKTAYSVNIDNISTKKYKYTKNIKNQGKLVK